MDQNVLIILCVYLTQADQESSQQFIGYLLQLSIWQLHCLQETGRKDGSFGSLRLFYFRVFWQSQMYLRKTNHENDICSWLRTAIQQLG